MMSPHDETTGGITRGFGEREFRRVGELVHEVIQALSRRGGEEGEGGRAVAARVPDEVHGLCAEHPVHT